VRNHNTLPGTLFQWTVALCYFQSQGHTCASESLYLLIVANFADEVDFVQRRIMQWVPTFTTASLRVDVLNLWTLRPLDPCMNPSIEWKINSQNSVICLPHVAKAKMRMQVSDTGPWPKPISLFHYRHFSTVIIHTTSTLETPPTSHNLHVTLFQNASIFEVRRDLLLQ
jgi:hypothetical protein